MRISHRNRYIFLSNPRCGSTSMRNLFDKHSDISSTANYPYHHHTGARSLKKHFESKGWAWNEYVKITTIRNPWDRAVSIWLYGQKNSKSVWHKHYNNHNKFHDFVIELPNFLRNTVYAGSHKKAGQYGISIDEFAYSEDGERLVDHILPIESIDVTLPPILQQIGLPLTNIPHVNSTSHGAYQKYYDDDEILLNVISSLFKTDIEEGGYKF